MPHMPGEAAGTAVNVECALIGTMQVPPDQGPHGGSRRAFRRMTALALAKQNDRHATSKRSEPGVRQREHGCYSQVNELVNPEDELLAE